MMPVHFKYKKKSILTSAHPKMDIFLIGLQGNVPKHPKNQFLQSKYFIVMMSQGRCEDRFRLPMAYITGVRNGCPLSYLDLSKSKGF